MFECANIRRWCRHRVRRAISSTIADIVSHMGTLNKYSVSITPVIRFDIKDEKVPTGKRFAQR